MKKQAKNKYTQGPQSTAHIVFPTHNYPQRECRQYLRHCMEACNALISEIDGLSRELTPVLKGYNSNEIVGESRAPSSPLGSDLNTIHLYIQKSREQIAVIRDNLCL